MSAVHPYSINYATNTATQFSGSTVGTFANSVDAISGSCLLPPCTIDGTRYSAGILIVQYFNKNGSSFDIRVDAFDCSTGARLDILGQNLSSSLAYGYSTYYYLRPYPMGRAVPGGYIFTANDGGTAVIKIKAVRPSGVSDVWSITQDNGQMPTDISFAAHSSRPAFHVAMREDSNASTSRHLHYFAEHVDSSGAGTIAWKWSKRFTTADWATWGTSPTGILAVQEIPWPKTGDSGKIAVLLGTIVFDTLTRSYWATSPKLAILRGGPNADGTVLDATGDTSTGEAYGMCVNQHGDVFVSLRKTLDDGSGLLVRYNYSDLSAPEKVLLSGDFPNWRYLGPLVWDGSKLIAFPLFADTDSQYIYTFDRDLNYLGRWRVPKQNQSGSGQGGYKPWISISRFSHRWWGWNN